ncbi:MAG: Gfo/Idh/MocA family oxidoreductase [Eubacteriales bacterium]|nr:Gfo/Idh/MocA family oxidoreductase [Eubacteriales bacterium]
MMKKLRFGILGAGEIAVTRTIPAMLECEYAVPAAVMNTKIEKARNTCEKFGIPAAYDSVDSLLADESIDAVYIASPVYLHTALTKKAADYGKHVLCEKPLGMNTEDALSAVEYCREKGVLLSVGLMMRYGTHIRNVKRIISEGGIGQVVSGNARFSCWTPDRPGHWLHQIEKAGGGPVMDMGFHLIDIMQYITGMKVTAVTAMQERITFSGDDYTVDDSSTLIMRMQNGAQFVVQTNFNIPDTAAKWRLDFYGTKGRLLGDMIVAQEDGGILNAITLSDTDDMFLQPEAGFGPGKNIEGDFGNMYRSEIDSFSLSILNGTPVEVDPMEAVQVQRIIDAAYRSSREGITVSVPFA